MVRSRGRPMNTAEQRTEFDVGERMKLGKHWGQTWEASGEFYGYGRLIRQGPDGHARSIEVPTATHIRLGGPNGHARSIGRFASLGELLASLNHGRGYPRLPKPSV
jgi:hypothetical protein